MASSALERLEHEAVRVFGPGAAVEIDSGRSRKLDTIQGTIWRPDGKPALVVYHSRADGGKAGLIRAMRARLTAYEQDGR